MVISSNIFISETASLIKAKFHVEPPWEGGTKIYINCSVHMTKIAAMPIYGKNLQISSQTELSPMNLKLSMNHYVLKLYKVYINAYPSVDLDLFFDNVKFGETCFLYL